MGRTTHTTFEKRSRLIQVRLRSRLVQVKHTAILCITCLSGCKAANAWLI